MYASLEQFKQYLGIEDNTQDTLLGIFLQSAGEIINSYCGVDSFIEGDREELIDMKGIYENSYGLFFFVKNYPVSSVKELNSSEYEGVSGSDYLVVNDRELIFKKLPIPPMGYLQIKYTSGFSTIPGNLQLAEMMIASGLWQQKGNEGVSSYKLGDETIVFGNKTVEGEDSDIAYFKVKTLLDKYRTFNLPV